MRIKDRVALVTGASRGIGKAIATVLGEEGAIVIVNYLKNREMAEEVVSEIESRGGRAISIRADVTKSEEVEGMTEEIYRQFERIDILVNNAGITRDQLLLSMEQEEWEQVINTNLGGMFNCTRAVAKYMLLQKSGKVINMSSVAGERGGRGQCNYAASKGGVNAFTRAVAMELSPKGITVNAVAPGAVETEMTETVVRRAKDHIINSIALKRLGKAAEIAGTVLFLASDDAGYITGEVIRVDGGYRA